MNILFSVLIATSLLFVFTKEAHAIIVVVPAILIPIVSIVVWIIGALATPVVALSALFFRIKKKSLFLGILFGLGLLLIIGVIITLIFKLVDPQMPIY